MNDAIASYNFEGLASAGFYIALRLGYAYPVAELNALPKSWVDLYTVQGFMLSDPVLRWVYSNTGAVRWSEIEEADPRGILDAAKEYGMQFGVTISWQEEGDRGLRSFGSFLRNDREFTDLEISQLAASLEDLHQSHAPPTNLTNAELEALRMVRDGLLMKQVADELGVSLGAVKQRLKNAKQKLRAKTSSQAIALAVEHGLI
ncbi:helix-turn-helix transcriptional regulator [Cochlodiniinecator piscidefendens]|uniref:helix-turn-helix transcriptional regulator n=1 Tax=Cochlodiniinecator piscidefendens TaxID=2715756 RepID=UPI00140D73C1|nr:autoinducer binding domain-containing protein [Cochlodiniinecator piscidefendens]